jgi:hypothetical protein
MFPIVRRGRRRAACVSQQHQCEQPGNLSILGQLIAKLTCQPDRLAGELDTTQGSAEALSLASVEDQIEHAQHCHYALLAFAVRCNWNSPPLP